MYSILIETHNAIIRMHTSTNILRISLKRSRNYYYHCRYIELQEKIWPKNRKKEKDRIRPQNRIQTNVTKTKELISHHNCTINNPQTPLPCTTAMHTQQCSLKDCKGEINPNLSHYNTIGSLSLHQKSHSVS